MQVMSGVDIYVDECPDNTTSSLLNNGEADSSAVGWPPCTSRSGASPRRENSAPPSSSSGTSSWRKNPLARLVRHRKDAAVCVKLCPLVDDTRSDNIGAVLRGREGDQAPIQTIQGQIGGGGKGPNPHSDNTGAV